MNINAHESWFHSLASDKDSEKIPFSPHPVVYASTKSFGTTGPDIARGSLVGLLSCRVTRAHNLWIACASCPMGTNVAESLH